MSIETCNPYKYQYKTSAESYRMHIRF